MAKLFSTLSCCVLLALLCSFGEVVECKQASRRRDVHRIILKEKNRNRSKKHARPSPNHNGPLENPFFDQIGEFSNHYVRYHNRHPDQFRAHHHPPNYQDALGNYNQNFDKYHPDINFRPQVNNAAISGVHQNHQVMDIEDFNKHQDGYRDSLRSSYNGKLPGDYDRYKQQMEHYNVKNEEQFRMKMEKSKQQVPYAEENLSAMATHNFPNFWHAENADTFKGSWNPVSTVGTSLTTEFTNDNIKRFPHQNIEDVIELTTSKEFVLPSMIVETNLTNSFEKHGTSNFHFVPSVSPTVYHPNHKYAKNKPGEVRHVAKHRNKNSYQVREEENGESSGVVPSVLGSFQNLSPLSSTSARIPEEKLPGPNLEGFGLKTKARRTKRPTK